MERQKLQAKAFHTFSTMLSQPQSQDLIIVPAVMIGICSGIATTMTRGNLISQHFWLHTTLRSY